MMKKRINKLPKHIFFITIIGTLLVLCSIFPVSKTITKIMMTSKNYEEPANNAFTDQNFYNCVVDAYNKKNPDDHKEYTDNLTDEELQTIVTLSCLGSGKSDNEKITDTTGLEKLSNITSLDLRNNKLSNIDLSNNIYLTFLSLGSNQLFSIDVKHNTNLTQLYLSSNQITEIDVNQNTKLTYLDLRDNNLNKIDVITNIELLYLDLGWNKITNINVSTNKELKVLDLQYNDLSSIDVDTNKNLTSLDLSHNELTDIDVRNNKELGVLDLRNNQLSVADLTSNTKLYHLYLNDNQLTTVDLSSNQLLTALDLSNNQLVAIDVTQNTKLTDLSLEHNNLSSIDLSKNTKLTRLDLQDNPFAVNISIYKDEEKKLTTDLGCVKLPEGKTSTWTKITNFNNMNMDDNIVSANAGGLYKVKVDYRHNVVPYTPYGADTYSITYNIYVIETTSSKYTIGEDYIYVGTETDNETIINNIELNYGTKEIQDNQLIVKYNDEIIKTFDIVSISSEKYNLNNEYLLVGKDTVEQSDITVTNGEVSIEDDEVLIKRDDDVLQTFYKSAFKDQNFYNCIIDRYNESSTLEDISYSKHLSDEKLAKFTFIQCNGMNADDDKKITNTDGIEKLTNLETLYIINHALVSIDTNQNSALETLHLYNNKLTNIHSEKNSKLVELDINNNELTNIDVTMYPGLTKLNISHNNLNFIDVSQNQKLTYLDVSFNQLSSLELKNLPLLKTLYTSNNQLSTLDLKTNTKLQLLDITKNQIAHLDLKNNLDISVFSAKDNLFNANIALYKNEYKNISKDLGFVEWPSEKTIIFRGIHDKDSEIGWDYDNNSITSSTVGMYHIGASYGLASSSYSNEYRGIYNVYVIEATSSKYTIGDDYIYVGAETNNDTILNNIELNYGTKEIQDNQLVIKYNDEIIKTFDIVSISSDDYDLKKDYIYTVNEDFDLNKVDVINGSKEQVEDELQIKRDTTILDRFELLSIKFGELKVGNKRIVIKDETTYEDFTGNITINGVTYKIYNDQEEVDNGTISKGMTLKVYKDDEEIDSFEITNEYLDWGNLVRDEEHKVIKKVKAGTTVEDIVNEISTSGTIIKKDKNGSPLQDEDVIKTGDVIRVELSSENYEYKISVVGDVTGDGQVNIADVGKLYKHVRATTLMEEWCEKIAGDVVEDNNIIISDVGKLYKYVRNTIEEL